MTDVVDPKTRSRMMAGIRSKNTKPEMELRKALHALGYRFRLHHRGLAGRPDLVLPKYRAVIFVHGCFWHRHKGCRYCTTPATRVEFWQEKFVGNIARDLKNLEALLSAGWRVATVWECAFKNGRSAASVVQLDQWLASDHRLFETAPVPTETF